MQASAVGIWRILKSAEMGPNRWSLLVLATVLLDAAARSHRASRYSPLNTPKQVFTSAAASDFSLSVLDFGARGDNSTDNTQAFTLALANASGRTVLVPPGLYRFSGNLTVPAGATLAGSFDVVPSHDLRAGQSLNDGSVLIPTQGRGVPCDIDCTTAFIVLGENAGLRGFSIYYQEQETVQTPVAYPWSVFMNGARSCLCQD